jgi:hypothetical protein
MPFRKKKINVVCAFVTDQQRHMMPNPFDQEIKTIDAQITAKLPRSSEKNMTRQEKEKIAMMSSAIP